MNQTLWDRIFVGLLACITLLWTFVLGLGVYLLMAHLLKTGAFK